MTTYGIYFTNQYSDPDQSQDYALFCDLPKVSSSTGSPQVYSNVFLSKRLAADAHWDISITKNYWAWCGTAKEQLAPGVEVSVGMSKLATLGAIDAPGSTFEMYNNEGAPAFYSKTTYTANLSSYEIDSGTDFTSNMNFLMGLGGPDESGRMRPLASITAPRNARVNIAPVTKYYIAAYSATAGTVINTSSVSREAATIDFGANPGMYGAIVTQTNNGKWTVRYVSQAGFALVVNPPHTFQLNQLQYYIDQIQRLVNSANDEVDRDWYACSANWVGDVSNADRLEIMRLLADAMDALGYQYENGGIITKLLMNESHAQPSTLAQAVIDWAGCIANLPINLRVNVVNPNVIPTPPALEGAKRTIKHERPAANGVVETEVDTIKFKKQRALKLLEDQGLAGALVGSF